MHNIGSIKKRGEGLEVTVMGVAFCVSDFCTWTLTFPPNTNEKKYFCTLTAFVYVCGNLDCTWRVVDLVFEIWIIHKLQLQRRRGLQWVLLFSILRLRGHTHTHTRMHPQVQVSKQKKCMDRKTGETCKYSTTFCHLPYCGFTAPICGSGAYSTLSFPLTHTAFG